MQISNNNDWVYIEPTGIALKMMAGYQDVKTKKEFIIMDDGTEKENKNLSHDEMKRQYRIVTSQSNLLKLSRKIPTDMALVSALMKMNCAVKASSINPKKDNPNLDKNPLFKIVMQDDVAEKGLADLNKLIATLTFIRDISPNERKNLAIGLGVNISGLTDTQILMELKSQSEEPIVGQDENRFYTFLQNGNLEQRVIINKAINHGLILRSGEVYKYGQTIVGSNIDNVVIYYMERTDLFKSLKNEVQHIESLTEDEVSGISIPKELSYKKIQYDSEQEEMEANLAKSKEERAAKKLENDKAFALQEIDNSDMTPAEKRKAKKEVESKYELV